MKKSLLFVIGRGVPRRLPDNTIASGMKRFIRIIVRSLVKGVRNNLRGWMR